MDIKTRITRLKDLKLVKDGGAYYLSATYTQEDGPNKYELEVPRIYLPLRQEPDIKSYMLGEHEGLINLGFGELTMRKVDGYYYKVTTIQKELTLEEIEKRLGYKVKIVSKK